jgi:hypothetical protein
MYKETLYWLIKRAENTQTDSAVPRIHHLSIVARFMARELILYLKTDQL